MSESVTVAVKLPPRAEDGHFLTEDGEEDPRVWKVYATSAGSFPLVAYGEKLMPAWYARRLAARTPGSCSRVRTVPRRIRPPRHR